MTEIRFKPEDIVANSSTLAVNQSALAGNQSALAANISTDAIQTSSLASNQSVISTKVGRGPLSGNKKINNLGFDTSSGEFIFEHED